MAAWRWPFRTQAHTETAPMAERVVEANGIELCTEAFGDPADPPILLVMGIGASMLWWDEEFCHMLADRGRRIAQQATDRGCSACIACARLGRGPKLIARRLQDVVCRRRAN